MRKLSLVLASLLAVAFSFATMPAKAGSHAIEACLITKTDINPFFVKMKEGAKAKADELGIKLSTFAGKIDGDHETQVKAVETCIASGASGILIAASDTKAITTPLQQARDAGLLVIALDTPLEPITAADSTFATDNFKAGQLIGEWAAASFGDTSKAIIAMLNLNISQPSVDVLRDQGFLTGFGIDTKDISKWGDEDDPRIVGNEPTNGNEEGGRDAMEKLLQKNPDINVVYTLNEPAAAGAYEALKAAGKADDGILIVSVDGGCPGVQDVKDGVIGATSQQYPLLMASLGVEAIKAWADNGTKPANTPGLDFFDTGVNLVTDQPASGVPSIDTKEGMDRCWG
tara:strand:- start:269 stop:1300 length:1032 start_codon:yes stop_codon:yes gene_type:complete